MKCFKRSYPSDSCHQDFSPYISSLDAIRALACVMVVIFHMGNIGLFYPVPHAGMLGVMLFFSLSGFIMTYNYFPGKRHAGYWLAFLILRFFRIYPAFVFFLLLLSLCAYVKWFPLFWWYQRFNFSEVIAHLLLLMGRGVLWTIQIELKFYLFLPVLAGCFWLLRSPQLAFILLLCMWGALLIHYQQYTLNKSEPMSFWPYLSYFLGGMVACFLYRISISAFRLPQYFWNSVALASLAVFLLSTYDLLSLIGSKDLMAPWNRTYIFSPLTALIVLGMAMSYKKLHVVFLYPAATFLGRISYSMYLIHTLLLLYLHQYKDVLSFWPLFVFSWLVLIAASYVCYLLIEQPMMQYGRKLAARFQ